MEHFNPQASVVLSMDVGGCLRHEPVQAEVYGQWAVHVSCGKTKLRDPFTVTHIPSGAAVRSDITLDAARSLAGRLQPVPAFEAVVGLAWLTAAPRIHAIVRAQ